MNNAYKYSMASATIMVQGPQHNLMLTR